VERITELFVVVENRPGALGDLLGHLSKEKINIEAVGLFQDVAKISVSDVERGKKALIKAGYQVELRDVLRIDLDNRPGSFAFAVSRLGAAGINLDYCYGTVGKGQHSAAVIIDVEDTDRAAGILERANL